MRIYSKNNAAKFHPDPIWNNVTLGFLEEVPKKNKKKNNNKMSSAIRWVPDLKIHAAVAETDRRDDCS